MVHDDECGIVSVIFFFFFFFLVCGLGFSQRKLIDFFGIQKSDDDHVRGKAAASSYGNGRKFKHLLSTFFFDEK